jgi:hypothetical protein
VNNDSFGVHKPDLWDGVTRHLQTFKEGLWIRVGHQ